MFHSGIWGMELEGCGTRHSSSESGSFENALEQLEGLTCNPASLWRTLDVDDAPLQGESQRGMGGRQYTV